jgi:hypothetical protein
MKLEINQSQIINLNPSLQWQDTEIDIVAGEKYSITASGEWKDWCKSVSGEGYNYPLLPKKFKRVPGEKLAALMGAVGQTDKGAFLIGKSCEKTFTGSGRLYLFVNDMKIGGWFWRNNSGTMKVGIRRVG